MKTYYNNQIIKQPEIIDKMKKEIIDSYYIDKELLHRPGQKDYAS